MDQAVSKEVWLFLNAQGWVHWFPIVKLLISLVLHLYVVNAILDSIGKAVNVKQITVQETATIVTLDMQSLKVEVIAQYATAWMVTWQVDQAVFLEALPFLNAQVWVH